MAWSDLWAQFAALAGSLLLLGALAKTRPGKAFIRNNVTQPFAKWLHGILQPTNDRIDGIHLRLYELADTLGYEFSANGGGSLRDRVNAGVEAAGGAPDPLKSEDPEDLLH